MAKEKTLGELGLDPENMKGQEVDPLESLGRLGKDFVGAMGGVAKSLALPTESGETIADRNARILQEQELQGVESEKEESFRLDTVAESPSPTPKAPRPEAKAPAMKQEKAEETAQPDPDFILEEQDEDMVQVRQLKGVMTGGGKTVLYYDDRTMMSTPFGPSKLNESIQSFERSYETASPEQKITIMEDLQKNFEKWEKYSESWSPQARRHVQDGLFQTINPVVGRHLGLEEGQLETTSIPRILERWGFEKRDEALAVDYVSTVSEQKALKKLFEKIPDLAKEFDGDPVSVYFELNREGLLEGLDEKKHIAEANRRMTLVEEAVEHSNAQAFHMDFQQDVMERESSKAAVGEAIQEVIGSNGVLGALRSAQRTEGIGPPDARLVEKIMALPTYSIATASKYQTKESVAARAKATHGILDPSEEKQLALQTGRLKKLSGEERTQYVDLLSRAIRTDPKVKSGVANRANKMGTSPEQKILFDALDKAERSDFKGVDVSGDFDKVYADSQMSLAIEDMGKNPSFYSGQRKAQIQSLIKSGQEGEARKLIKGLLTDWVADVSNALDTSNPQPIKDFFQEFANSNENDNLANTHKAINTTLEQVTNSIITGVKHSDNVLAMSIEKARTLKKVELYDSAKADQALLEVGQGMFGEAIFTGQRKKGEAYKVVPSPSGVTAIDTEGQYDALDDFYIQKYASEPQLLNEMLQKSKDSRIKMVQKTFPKLSGGTAVGFVETMMDFDYENDKASEKWVKSLVNQDRYRGAVSKDKVMKLLGIVGKEKDLEVVRGTEAGRSVKGAPMMPKGTKKEGE